MAAGGVSGRGTASAGRRRADRTSRPRPGPKRLRRFVLLVLGVAACAVAWAFLVRAAIDFGQAGRQGNNTAWAVCGAATVGAAVCLLLAFVLLARTRVLFARRPHYEPRRSSGGRRTHWAAVSGRASGGRT